MPLSEEEKQRRREALARGREKAAANRAALKAAQPKPVAMPLIVYDDDPAPLKFVAEPDARDERPEPLDDFDRFLAAQDADTREALSDLELRVTYDVAIAKAKASKKDAAKKLAAQRAERHARATTGLIGPEAVAALAVKDRQGKRVTWQVNMPEAGNSGTLIDEGFRRNGILYPHGTWMEGTVGEYESYREIEGRARENERLFKGESKMQRLAQSGMRFLNNEGHA